MAAFNLEGIVGCPCRNEDKFRHVLADPLSVLTTLHSVKHILNKEECRSVAQNRLWWDGLALVLAVKPPVVVQDILGMLEKDHEKRWYGDATNAIKLLSNMYQNKLVDEDDIEWMKGKDGYLPDRVVHLQCSKHPEMMTRSAYALDMFGYYDSANQLRELNELSSRHLLTSEECSEVAEKRWMWTDRLAKLLLTKPTEIQQAATQVLDYYVKKELKKLTKQLLDGLYHEKLLTEDEMERMKRNEVSTYQLVHMQCIKPEEAVTRTAVVLNKLGFSESTRQMKVLSELYQGQLLTEDEVKGLDVQGDLPAQLVIIQHTKSPRVVKRSSDVLHKLGYNQSAKELRVLSELYQGQLLTEDEVKGLDVQEDLPAQLVIIQHTKPPSVVKRSSDVLHKLGYNQSAKELRGIIQTHGLSSDPRYKSSLSLLDLRNRGATPLSSDFGYGTSATPSIVSRYGSLATLSSDMTYESSRPSSSDSQYGSSTTLPSDLHFRSADSRYKGPATAATSTHSSSSLVKHYQKKPLHPHDKGRFSVQELSLEEDAEEATSQGTKVHSQPAGGGLDPPKAPDNVSVNNAEAALIDLCWIPLGIQSQSIGAEGGKLSLASSGGAMRSEEEMTFSLEVPPGAVRPSERIDIHYAAIPYGPFTLPEGYQFGSMVVYVYYDNRHVMCPLRLLLPHWCGEEDHVQNGLTFAMAPHTLNKGEHVYHFQLLEGGRRLSNHCGELEIDGHCSLFAQVFKKGVMSRYQALSLQREQGNEMTCDVAVTYAFPLWCEILTQYGSGRTFDKCSSSFTFGEKGLKGELKKERGNGWEASIKGSHELMPCDVEYDSLGITSSKMLKKAVLSKGYPPAITLAVTYREDLRKKGNPVWVGMEIVGAEAKKKLTFVCKAYEETHCLQLNGSRNGATDSQPPLSQSPNMEATTPPCTESASPSSLTPVSDADMPLTPAPSPQVPDIADILDALNHKLDAQWRQFGTFLHVDYLLIEAIRTGSGGRLDECMLDLVGRWISKQAGTGDLPRTWQTVVDAVKKVGFVDIAEKLAPKHGVNLSH